MTTLKQHLTALGKKGGAVKGKSKRRGSADYYRALQAKSAASRKAKALSRLKEKL